MLSFQDADEKRGLRYPAWLSTLMARYAADRAAGIAAVHSSSPVPQQANGAVPALVSNVAHFAFHIAELLTSALPVTTEEAHSLETVISASSDGKALDHLPAAEAAPHATHHAHTGHSSSSSTHSHHMTRSQTYWTRRVFSFLLSVGELKGTPGRDAKSLEQVLLQRAGKKQSSSKTVQQLVGD
jgi:hypothetical protein